MHICKLQCVSAGRPAGVLLPTKCLILRYRLRVRLLCHHSLARAETTRAAVRRGLRIYGRGAIAVTAPCASTGGTCQTAYLIAAFGWVECAHPDLLLDVLRGNWIPMT